MKNVKRSLGLCLTLGMLAFSAHAQLIKCSESSSSHPDGLSVTDVTFGLSTETGNAANDCYGVYSTSGTGGAPAQILNAFNTAWPDQWNFLLKDDSGGSNLTATYNGIQFTLSTTNVPSSTSGTWNLAWEAMTSNLPAYFDIGIAIKASNQAANYFFDDLLFPVSPTQDSGDWQVAYQNNGEQIPAISGLWLYIRAGSGTPPIPPNPAPEPGILWLLGTAMLSLRLIARRHG